MEVEEEEEGVKRTNTGMRPTEKKNKVLQRCRPEPSANFSRTSLSRCCVFSSIFLLGKTLIIFVEPVVFSRVCQHFANRFEIVVSSSYPIANQ